ncbi:hypothetical protein PC116_g13632 [Phytophthora cactorum]|nr:hypothetical protein PC119_g9749 [Phytophthora cactorum]KAG4238346.1 hypothetical protein PC116_g13632 [Phytophthora cactorum]
MVVTPTRCTKALPAGGGRSGWGSDVERHHAHRVHGRHSRHGVHVARYGSGSRPGWGFQ